MFLKSIEIRGFKSFADKTELDFKKGVTVVVGPNGSGKSNISDAVRWVLGEQSIRNLRGDKMEDVIFAGTQYRKPVGLAQVSLTLDNSDGELDIAYSQVTVSRRLYRSGESEYLINNTVCRLKDVQALFMDTGIGKEGYSIIGQGKIDAILSAKSEDRRKLLEEAAGIVKYKTRKEEAEKRLSNTEQNLVRINDILSTYEERLPALEEDSEKAKKFLKLSEEVKVKEVNIIVDFLEKTKHNRQTIHEDISRVDVKKAELDKKKNEFKAELDERNKALEQFNELVDEKKRVYYETQNKHQSILGDVKLFEEKISHLGETVKRLQSDNVKKEQLVEEENRNAERLNEGLSKLRAEEASIEEALKLKEDEILSMSKDVSSFNDRITGLESIRNDSSIKINQKINEKGILNNNVQIANGNIEKLILDVQTHKNSIIINKKTRDILSKEETQSKEKIYDLEEKIKQNRKEMAKLKQNASAMENELKGIVRTQGNKEARLNALVTLENSYEGYNRAVKLLMKYIDESAKYKSNEDCFVLGDVIKVPTRVEKAVEVAMGANISNIVTRSEAIAKELIGYLKQNKLGRATFMPMDIVKGRVINVDKAVLSQKGYIGIASELIEFDMSFKGVIDHVLGKTLVCEDMESGAAIAKIGGYKYRIVTLDGEVFNPGGTLTGGSYAKNANVIGRKREIEELKSEIEKSHAVIEAKNKEIAEVNISIKKTDDEGLNLRDEIHYENINITKIGGEIKRVIEEETRNDRELKRSIEELEKEKKKLKTMEVKLSQISIEMDELNEAIAKVEAEYSSISSDVKEKNSHIERLKEELTSIKVNKAKITEMIASSNSEYIRLKKSISVELENIDENKKTIESILEDQEEYRLSIKKNDENIKSALDSLKELELFFDDAEVKRLELKEKLPVITAKIEDINLLVEKLEKEINKDEVSLAKIEAEENTLLKKLNEEYEMTYAEGLSYKLEDYDVTKLKADVAALKREITELGVVNLGAIEEFKEVNQKYTFMNEQREDLVTSKSEIEEFITEMTETMRKVFMANFKQLRVYFDETFKELFKGGSADLMLQGDDELSCKIEINVEPPGKKLQNINLLSGGEKVLSAIALLFAILKMKPTPFCILDEIEAALDDANVLRYGEFLKKFSSEVQFIVITHRKGTMETSDAIYGVTMEEKGVSKVVSLELTK